MQKGLNEKLEADYVRPESLETAVSALAAQPRVILAGGTDVFPRLQDRPLSGPVLDISGIPALRTIGFLSMRRIDRSYSLEACNLSATEQGILPLCWEINPSDF